MRSTGEGKDRRVFPSAGRAAGLGLLLGLALLCLGPALFILEGSLMDSGELQGYLKVQSRDAHIWWPLLPAYPTLVSYVELLLDLPRFFVMFWNSVRMTGSTLAGQLLVGIPAAWALARSRSAPGRWCLRLYTVLMLLPFQVRMLSDYLVLDRLRMMDTRLAVMMPGIFSTFPVFVMQRFFRQIPEPVLEAARLDGAGELGVFRYIALPLGTGGIVSALTLGFLECWNQVEQPMTFLKNPELWPLALFLPQITTDQAALAFAASAVTLLPSLLIFLMGQEYLEAGIMASAVKE